MPTTDVEITELEEFTPTRVDGVGKGANGFPILMLKSVGDEINETLIDLEDAIDEIDKAAGQSASAVDDDRPVCTTCKGDGKIMGNKRSCPKCKGSGKMPKVGDTVKASDGSAASGADVPVLNQCPTCNGSGTLPDPSGSGQPKECVDCGGSGEDAKMPTDDALSRVDAPAGSVQVGDARETIDKSEDEDVEKDGSVISGTNPAMPTPNDPSAVAGDPTDPGSPAWEAVDAQALIAAGQQLARVAQMLQTSQSRESQEVAAGHAEDMADVMDLNNALQCLDQCLGLVAAMAFREEAEANKSVDETDGVAEKAGKRLSNKTISQVAGVRDHLTELLGDDDPAKPDGDATKSEKDISDMTSDELIKLLDERDEARKEAKKATKQDVDNTDSIAAGKKNNSKAKAKSPEDEDKDLEDEADQGSGSSASNGAMGAAKSESDESDEAVVTDEAAKAVDVATVLTPEEIEADEAVKAAKKVAKAAKKAKKQATENAAITKALEESKAQAEEAVKALEERLATVEKMAAPGGPAKTRPQEAVNKAAERDALDLQIDKYERLAKTTNDNDYRRECLDRAKALRVQLTTASQ